jgi:hypothetical protein
MPEPVKYGPAPQNYQRIEGSERLLAPGARLVSAADPSQILPVVIRVKPGAGQPGLDRVMAFARSQRSMTTKDSSRKGAKEISGHLTGRLLRSECTSGGYRIEASPRDRLRHPVRQRPQRPQHHGTDERFIPTDYFEVKPSLTTTQNAPQEPSTLVELYGMYTYDKPGARPAMTVQYAFSLR